MQELKAALSDAAKKLFGTDLEPDISRPALVFGDYATNMALQLAKQAAATPRQMAEQLAAELRDLPGIAEVTIAGPGFINFRLTDERLAQAAFMAADLPKPLADQEILVEFGDPNPFKEMHIGHLYSYVVGDAIASLLESQGAVIRRLSYHGDVGLHVAKAIWAMQQADGEPSQALGSYYATGAKAYEESPAAKAQIDEINAHIYRQDDPKINEIYDAGHRSSFEHFDRILAQLGIRTDKRYLESQTAEPGRQLVDENIGKVFTKSQNAIIFEGEKAGLHTRVFITAQGLPTYETKDLGLVILKAKDYPRAARSIVITANEQSEYFKVMLAALAEIDKPLAGKTTHLAHGFVKLISGKMSSRTGDVYAAANLLAEVDQATSEQYPQSAVQKAVGLGAIKYAFTKNRIGPDLVFDIRESISLDGNSGPYLQYAYARACSILAKAPAGDQKTAGKFDESERNLALKISEYPEVIQESAAELMPHHIATYLYELAQTFNRFYESSRIVGDERQAIRLQLVKSYRQVLKSGLNILNIEAPERM